MQPTYLESIGGVDMGEVDDHVEGTVARAMVEGERMKDVVQQRRVVDLPQSVPHIVLMVR